MSELKRMKYGSYEDILEEKMEEINKQAKVIQWYEKDNKHNQEIIIKQEKEIKKFKKYSLELEMKNGKLEVEIYNIQNKINKAIEANENIRKKLLSCSSYEKEEVEDLILLQEDILKGEV